MSVWIQLNSAFSIYVCVLLKLRSTSAKRKRKLKTHMGGNARLLRNASFQPHYLTKSIVNSTFVHCSQTHKFYFSVIFFIKNGFHGTIHTFKNYFAAMFSVSNFSFSKNKLIFAKTENTVAK